MPKKKLEDDFHELGSISMIADLFVPRFKIVEFNAEDFQGPEVTWLDVLLETSAMWKFVAEINSPELLSLQEDHSCTVTNINCEGWFMAQVQGPRPFIVAAAAAAEALGAMRAPS